VRIYPLTATPRGAKPETDDTQNPTSASPESPALEGERGTAAEYGADSTYAAGTGPAADTTGADPLERDPDVGGRRDPGRASGQQIVGQLQSAIETLSHQAAPVVRQATPVLREIAAKAAEIAALAAERAGPLARRAADVTQDVGVRVAARSREVASDLRRRQADTTSESGATGVRTDTAGDASPRAREGTQRPPTTPGL
jgi:hypothetical protein